MSRFLKSQETVIRHRFTGISMDKNTRSLTSLIRANPCRIRDPRIS